MRVVVRRGGLLRAGIAPDRDSGGDSGMVTAELAVALPSLVLVALLALSGVEVVMAKVRCRDAAAVASRLAARGESAAVVSAAATLSAPPDGRLSLRRDGELVVASVSAPVHLLGVGGLLPAITVVETAVAVAEQPQLP